MPFTACHDQLIALFDQQNFAACEQQAAKQVAAHPQDAFAWKTLGAVRQIQGKLELAAPAMQQACTLWPDHAQNWNNYGNLLKQQRKLTEAEASYRRALALDASSPDIHNNLGVVLKDLGRFAEAEACYHAALQRNPQHVQSLNNLGVVLSSQGDFPMAEACYRQVLALRPDYVEGYNNLGNVLHYRGQLAAAQACYQHALRLQPQRGDIRSNLLFVLNYLAELPPEHARAEAALYGQWLSAQHLPHYAHAAKPPRPDAPLRVGLVSGDLRYHPVGFFLESLVPHLAAAGIALFAYPTWEVEDSVTVRLKPYCTGWQPLSGLSDAAAAACIYADQLDVLLDLAGHSRHNRLPVFAYRPAPVQGAWLGYFATTGLAEMDFVLVDKMGVPPAAQAYFTEHVRYLPETRLCFTPPDTTLPVAALPALQRGYVTFGCFQNLAKLGTSVFALWGEILAALPTARLRIQHALLVDEAACQRILTALESAGIAASRVDWFGGMPREAYLAAHAEVDLILDTFPYPGGTTTCEALWMGVPTLTLAGDTLLARQGASLLSAAGLPDWIAETPADYVQKAIAFATNLPALAQLRQALRPQLAASPLFDAPRFAAALAATLRAACAEAAGGAS